MVSSEPLASSILTSVLAAGIAIADQDEHGNHRPDDLGRRAVVERGRHRALRFPERRDRIDHDAEDGDRDRHADPEDQHVQPVDLAAQRRHADAQVEVGPGRHGGGGPQHQGCAGRERTLHHLHGQTDSRTLNRRPPPAALNPCRTLSGRQHGRLARVSHQPLQSPGEAATFLFGEKPTHFTCPSVRLDHEPARTCRWLRAAQSNPRPVTRKYR